VSKLEDLMKLIRLISIVFMFSLVLAACGLPGGGDSGQAPGETANPVENVQVSPYPVQPAVDVPEPNPYPPDEEMQPQVAQPGSEAVYPELKDGDVLTWEQAVGAILSGQVTKVAQTHDLKVYITLKDGRTLETTEPAIDDVIQLVKSCGDTCKEIRVATE
jgi:hypothetical protein